MDSSKVKIDESLYSRQLYVLGAEAMAKMAQADVFLSGLCGLGVDIAKNIILAGVKSLTLHDTKSASYSDLSTQFYIRESDIGKNRAEACAQRLDELNPYVQVKVDTQINLDDVPLTYFNQFKCVISVNAPLKIQLRIDEHCRKHNVCFISSQVRGVFGHVFVDFGDNFEVSDVDGEEPKDVMIDSITQVLLKLRSHISICLKKNVALH
eukprot:TRINITY_DN2360_c0_g1_i2.p1 TRINITY_DN2360_c0_g1~~TRINITY_DN2360_c0_g1_i2.p1  ORF type:complete len:228 (+),score=28.38 TRINITY_DN2360_c0_g1_i2:60-686(+)